MRTYLRLFLLLAAAVATPACEDSLVEPRSTPNFAVAGAERIVEEVVYDLDGDTVMFFCVIGGEDIITEPIALRGRIVEQFTLLQLPSGGYHAGFEVKSQDVGGTGIESGAEYTVTERSHGVTNQTTMRDGGSYRSVFRVESKELGKSMNLVYQGSYTVNANGELVVERERMREECEL